MQRTRLIAVGWLITLIGGCSSTSPFGREKLAITATPQYVGGRGFGMFASTPNLVENVKAALVDVGMHSIHPVPESNGGTGLEASTSDQRSARVTIHTTGVRSTVALKVGWFGDEPLTRAFLGRLEERNGALPASAVPVEPETSGEPTSGARFSRSAVPDSVMIRNQLDPTFNPSISP